MRKFLVAFSAVLILVLSGTSGLKPVFASGLLSISPNSYTSVLQTISKAVCVAPMPYTYSASVYIYDNNGNNVFGSGFFDLCTSFNVIYNGMAIGGPVGFVVPANDSSLDGTWTMVLEQDDSQDFPTLTDALNSDKYITQSTFTFNY